MATTTQMTELAPVSTNEVGSTFENEVEGTSLGEPPPPTGLSHGPKVPSTRGKIGHRRVDETGAVTYKKKPTSELMAAIQLGIGQSIGSLTSKPERDVLMQDFAVVESVFFPSEGSNLTPAHHCSDFRFKTYAPVAFRYFRDLFGIQPDDFMLSLCDEPLKELSNPGASGSIFYLTQDDEFIIKTVQHKEADFLQKLLPGYYMNLNQNPRTSMPKFYGLYCYQCGGKNIRFVIMNNLLPSSVQLHEKYDLKGSTYKRKASRLERSKPRPTWKDLDFRDRHPEGIFLEKDNFDALMRTLQRDCMVLESFKIMDYSLLLAIHNLDTPKKSDLQTEGGRGSDFRLTVLTVTLYTTAMESIQAATDVDEQEDEDIPPGGIPARNAKGDRLLLFLGVIDILQCYRLKKKLEHTMKAIVIDGDTISVHRPSYYATRFQDFCAKYVFKKIQTPLKHSPSKRRGAGRSKIPSGSDGEGPHDRRTYQDPRSKRTISFTDEASVTGATGGRPDLLPENSTPPPTFAEAIASDRLVDSSPPMNSGNGVRAPSRSQMQISGIEKRIDDPFHREEAYLGAGLSGICSSPPASISESTPTHTDYTEGTPSYTASSPSCSSDVLDIGESSSASPVRGSPLKNGGRSPATSHSPEKMAVKYSPVKSTNKSVLDASENIVLNSSARLEESGSSVVVKSFKTVVHTPSEYSENSQEHPNSDSEAKNLQVEVMHDSPSPYVSLTPNSARLHVGPFLHHKHLTTGDGDSLIVLLGSIKSMKSDDTNTDNSMLTDDLSQSNKDVVSPEKGDVKLFRQNEVQLSDSELKISSLDELNESDSKTAFPVNRKVWQLEKEETNKLQLRADEEFQSVPPKYFSGSSWNFGRGWSRISLPGSKKLYEPVLCSFRRSTPYQPLSGDSSTVSMATSDNVLNKSESQITDSTLVTDKAHPDSNVTIKTHL
ncbi:hypothetical protein ScPMuIL_003222 [Solemya velum]